MQLPMTLAMLNGSRSRRLYDELSYAVSSTNGAVLKQWGVRSAGRLVNLGARRVGGLSSLATVIGKGTWSELSNMIKAAGQGATLEHLGNRTAAAIDDSIALGKEGAGIVSAISRGLAFNPKAFMLVPVELMAMAEYPTADLAEVPLDARIRDGPLDDK